MEPARPVPPTQSTTRPDKPVTASPDTLSLVECASPRPPLPDLPPPSQLLLAYALIPTHSTSMDSASARLATTKSTEFVSSAPQELSTMLT
jgi:hypothetical protein